MLPISPCAWHLIIGKNFKYVLRCIVVEVILTYIMQHTLRLSISHSLTTNVNVHTLFWLYKSHLNIATNYLSMAIIRTAIHFDFNTKIDMAYRPSAIKIIVLWKLYGSEKDINFDIQTNGHKFLSWRHNC